MTSIRTRLLIEWFHLSIEKSLGSVFPRLATTTFYSSFDWFKVMSVSACDLCDWLE